MQRIKLFHSNDGGVVDLLFRAVIDKVVVNFAGTKNHAFHFVGRSNFGRTENFLELSTGKFFRGRRRKFGAQQTLWRHDHERFDEIAFHLPAEQVKVLRRSSQIADLNIVLGTKLKKAFEAAAGMFGALSFVTVRQQQYDPARPLPFRFSRNDELVDDSLGAIREISELRFPQTKHARIIERITVIEPEDGGFREQAVIDANARLLFAQMHQRHIRRTAFCVVKNRVPRAKSSPRAVLTG